MCYSLLEGDCFEPSLYTLVRHYLRIALYQLSISRKTVPYKRLDEGRRQRNWLWPPDRRDLHRFVRRRIVEGSRQSKTKLISRHDSLGTAFLSPGERGDARYTGRCNGIANPELDRRKRHKTDENKEHAEAQRIDTRQKG